MHIDDIELAEYYLKDIVEDAACIHGGNDSNWDCVFMICENGKVSGVYSCLMTAKSKTSLIKLKN